MIECKQLCFGYIKKPLCIKDLNLCVKKGEKVALLGGEGMGKTSLLRVLAGLENLYAGFVYINNKDAKEIELKDKRISYLPSLPVFFENKSIKENIDYLLTIENIQNFTENDLKSAFEKFSFDIDFNIKVKKLSSVDKKLLSIVRSYIKKPEIILIDDLIKNEVNDFEKINNAIKILIDELNASVIFAYNKNCEVEADKYLYLSYGNNFTFKSLDEIQNSSVDYFVSDYYDFNKKELVLTKRNDDYFICEFEIIKAKKRKNDEIIVKNAYKINKNNNKSFEKLEMLQEEIIKIDALSNVYNFDKIDEKTLNDLIKNGFIHLFENGTGVKIL